MHQSYSTHLSMERKFSFYQIIQIKHSSCPLTRGRGMTRVPAVWWNWSIQRIGTGFPAGTVGWCYNKLEPSDLIRTINVIWSNLKLFWFKLSDMYLMVEIWNCVKTILFLTAGNLNPKNRAIHKECKMPSVLGSPKRANDLTQ
jgi:hypothetical protein